MLLLLRMCLVCVFVFVVVVVQFLAGDGGSVCVLGVWRVARVNSDIRTTRP